MRTFAVLIEIILPTLLVLFLAGVVYKIVKFNRSYKQWKSTQQKNLGHYKKIPFSQMTKDWTEFVELFRKSLPDDVNKNLDSISENFESLKVKSEKENWDDPQNAKTLDISLLSEIVYKDAPELIEEFTELPKSVSVKKVNHEGKNAVQLLYENTTILAKSTQEITDRLFAENLKTMSVHQAYFKNKFGHDTKPSES